MGSTGKVTTEQVLTALSKVKDPDLRTDIVSLGFVKDLVIDGGKVSFTLELTTPACPVKRNLQEWAEAAVRQLPGVEEVQVKLAYNVRGRAGVSPGDLLPGVKNIIPVASGKGGVGKSTVAVNLAVSLRLEGARVGLLDADITGPNVPLMVGLPSPAPVPVLDNKILPLEAHGVSVMSIGFFTGEDTPAIYRGPMVHNAIRQFLSQVEWGELDYLVIDLPPGTGDAALTVCQLLPLTGAVMVATPQDVALLDVRKALMMFRRLNVPILGIIENFSFFYCPHCGERVDIFGHGGAERAAEKLDVPFLGAVPIDPRVRETGDAGTPVVISHPDSPVAEAFRKIARQVAARASTVAHLRSSGITIISGPR